MVLNEEDGRNGGKYVNITGTSPNKGKGVEIPADFVRAQDRPAK
jgi:hypothetical protein